MTKQPDPLRDAGMRALRGWHMAAFDQRTGHDHPVEDCTDKRFIDTLDALHVTDTPKYVAFTTRAAEAMTRRLGHGRAKFGVDWDEEPYRDEDNLERLRRAVDHLEAARRNSPDPEEWRKRAADVANQAFMFADLARLTEANHE